MIHQPRYKKISILFLLYFSQGLPFGFQATALPIYLRTQNVSLTVIGFVSALAAPWLFKALWAPLVDRYGSEKIGRRKSWIIPMQVLLFLTILFASFIPPEKNLMLLLLMVFLMNLFAATQDIAVDGLAVDLLGPKDLGPGNAAQVMGYKTGMLMSGGLLVWLSTYTGWNGLFIIMAILTLIPLIAIFYFKEETENSAYTVSHTDFKLVFKKVMTAFKFKGAGWFIAFIATYKLGEIMIDIMFKPFLVDSGFAPSQIGLWVGTYGMVASLAGSFFGGVLASRVSLFKALVLAASLRIVPLMFEFWLTLVQPTDIAVIGTTIAEHFFGGMLTTIMFACMMSQVNKQIGATHYTILASIEVLGKSPGAWASGLIAEPLGYSYLFALGILLSCVTLLLLPKLRGLQDNNSKFINN